MVTITFDKVTEQDLYKIRELVQKIWPVTFSEILSEEQIAYMLQMMYSQESLIEQLANHSEFTIVRADDTEAGFAAYDVTYGTCPKTAKLHKIYLLPEFQGMGLGKALMERVVTNAIENGCEILCLNVNRFNKKAIEIYQKLNFTIVKQEDIDIGNGYLMEDYVMEKKLINDPRRKDKNISQAF